MEAYIVIAVTLFMIVFFVWGKWPFGLITMTCCAILAVTGILTPQQAFAGFSNKNLLLLAGAFIVSSAFGKTGAVFALQKKIIGLQTGKSGKLLVVTEILTIILLSCFMPSPAILTIIFMIVGTMDSEGKITASMLILPAAALSTLWTGRIPVGVGATGFTRYNAFTEAYGYTLGMLDPIKGAILPILACSVYTIFAIKLLPKKEIDKQKLADNKQKQSTLTKKEEIIIYIIFICMMVGFFFSKALGNNMYMLPVVCAIILIFTKSVSIEDAKRTLSGDLIFMLAGIYVLADAMSSTGAGTIIGNVILKMIGGVNSQLGLVMIFTAVSLVVTNIMSNVATFNVLIPLAVSTAIAAGVNPVPVALAAGLSSTCACILPCSSGESAMCYGASGYKFKDTYKFTIPLILVYYVFQVLGITLFF